MLNIIDRRVIVKREAFTKDYSSSELSLFSRFLAVKDNTPYCKLVGGDDDKGIAYSTPASGGMVIVVIIVVRPLKNFFFY